MGFNPKEHLIKIERWDSKTKTYKTSFYLPTSWRVYWMRQEHPDWRIITNTPTLLKNNEGEVIGAMVEVQILDEKDKVISNAFGLIMAKDFNRFLEKAETAAIGRALWKLGYGIEYDDEEEFEDSEQLEQEKKEEAKEEQPKEDAKPATTNNQEWTEFLRICQENKVKVSEAYEILGVSNFKELLNKMTLQEAALKIIEYKTSPRRGKNV